MSSSLERYAKQRRCREVEIGGEKFKVRSLSHGEMERCDKVKPDLWPYLRFGLAMLEDDESQTFTQADGESDEEFAERARVAAKDIPLQTVSDLTIEISRVTKPPSLASQIKNSGETAT